MAQSEGRTTLNPSTIDAMVDSPSKKQKPSRYKLFSFGNMFLVRVVIHNKIERIKLSHYSDNEKSLEFESV